MQISQSQTREQFPLSRRKIIKKALTSTVFLAFLLLVLFCFSPILVSGFMNIPIISLISLKTFVIVLSFFLVTLAIVTLLNYLYQVWYFSTYFYDLTPDFIQIRKGTVTPSEITIPYERVQDVYVDQDLFDRIFGLYDVHLSSATVTSGIEAHIDGLEKPAADGLRKTLLQIIQQKNSQK